MSMNIKVREAAPKKSESILDALKSSDYLDGIDDLQDVFHEVEKKLEEYGLELILDARGDHTLTAVPKSISDKLGELTEDQARQLLDSSKALLTQKHLVSLLQ